ncbi:unnamed protein product [Paramecium sonneborni]|uniref:Uncharacterized protein n=1 Tax=Paramecium sonneborni TaxID=65129 RepID=A0A8S1M7X1_9CILI|nr:unnamed protein product [Paramecium sonneborni]
MNQYGQTNSRKFQQQQQNQQQQNIQPIPQQQQYQQQHQYQQKYQQYYQQKQQQLDLNNNQLQQKDQNAQFNNVAQYGIQFQQLDNFTNSNAIPQKIDLKFYQIDEKIYYIKAYLLLKYQNWQILYSCNHKKKKLIISKNLPHQNMILYMQGFWIVKITDFEYILYNLEYQVFEEYYKILTQQEYFDEKQDNVVIIIIVQRMNYLNKLLQTQNHQKYYKFNFNLFEDFYLFQVQFSLSIINNFVKCFKS